MEPWINALRNYKNNEAKEKKIIFVIGAGASMACGLPNWYGLAAEVMENVCDKKNGYSIEVQNRFIKQYAEIADPQNFITKFYDDLPSKYLDKIQKEILKKYTDNIEHPSGWMHSLYSIIPTLIHSGYNITIYTTNYDKLLVSLLNNLGKLPKVNVKQHSLKSKSSTNSKKTKAERQKEIAKLNNELSKYNFNLIELYSRSCDEDQRYIVNTTEINKEIPNIIDTTALNSFGLLFLIGISPSEPYNKELLELLKRAEINDKVFEFIKDAKSIDSSIEKPIAIKFSEYSQSHIYLEMVADYLASGVDDEKPKLPDPRYIADNGIVECNPRAEIIYQITTKTKKTIIFLTSPWGGGKTNIINWVKVICNENEIGEITNEKTEEVNIKNMRGKNIIIHDGADEPFEAGETDLKEKYEAYLKYFAENIEKNLIFIVSGRREAIDQYSTSFDKIPSRKNIERIFIKLQSYSRSEYALCGKAFEFYNKADYKNNLLKDSSREFSECLYTTPWTITASFENAESPYYTIVSKVFPINDLTNGKAFSDNQSIEKNSNLSDLFEKLTDHITINFKHSVQKINDSKVLVFIPKGGDFLAVFEKSNERLKYAETLTGFCVFLYFFIYCYYTSTANKFENFNKFICSNANDERISIDKLGFSKLTIEALGSFINHLGSVCSPVDKDKLRDFGIKYNGSSFLTPYLLSVFNYSIQIANFKKGASKSIEKSTEIIEDLAHESRRLGLVPTAYSFAIEETGLKFFGISTLTNTTLASVPRLPIAGGNIDFFESKNIHFKSLHLSRSNWNSARFDNIISEAINAFYSVGRELNLGNINFRTSNFGWCALMRSKFIGKTKPSDIDSYDESLQYCDVSQSSFVGANFSDSYFENVDFNDCSLYLTKFNACKFINCKFDSALIGDANFDGSNFINCTFLNANIYGSSFSHCTFENINWGDVDNTHARLMENTFRNTVFDSEKSLPSELSRDIFTGARFPRNKEYIFRNVDVVGTVPDSLTTIIINGFGQRIQHSPDSSNKGASL